MPAAFLPLLALYSAFVVYLLLAGAGLRRTVRVLAYAAAFACVFGLIGALFEVFRTVLDWVLFNIVALATATHFAARDFAVPRSNLVQVVCVNVFVLAIDQTPDYAFFQLVDRYFVPLLVNPLAFLIPADLWWLKTVLGLWPSALAMWLAARQHAGNRRVRFLLMVWTQVLCMLWVLPIVVSSLTTFDSSSVKSYALSVLASLCAVQVSLTFTAIVLTGGRNWFEEFFGSHPPIDNARDLAERLHVSSWPPFAYVAVAAAAYLFTWVVRIHAPSPGAVLPIVFTGVVLAGTLFDRSATDRASAEPTSPTAPSLHWLASVGALAVAMLGLTGFVRMPQYELRRTPLPRVAIREIDASAPCRLQEGRTVDLVCPQSRAAVFRMRHGGPVRSIPRLSFDTQRRFELSFGPRTLHCDEVAAQFYLPDGSREDVVLVLVYEPDATDVERYGWVVERNGSCARVEVVREVFDTAFIHIRYRGQAGATSQDGEAFASLGYLED